MPYTFKEKIIFFIPVILFLITILSAIIFKVM